MNKILPIAFALSVGLATGAFAQGVVGGAAQGAAQGSATGAAAAGPVGGVVGGVVGGATGAVAGAVGGLLGVDQRPAFRQYVVQERVPSYTYQQQVAVGAVLPETGVVYHEVPERFGVRGYRYTVVNNTPVLVEPRTRRIVEVIQ